MTSPRSYTIGLPVTITIDDDGTVTYEVDFSDATNSMDENDQYDDEGNELDVDEAALAEDIQHVDAAVTAHYQGGARLATTPR